MTVENVDVIELEIRIAARPETVFAFLTDPEKMVLWKGVTAELDPRPGGLFRVNVTGRDIARGEYLEVVPYSKVVFSWGWEGEGSPVPPGGSRVEVTLTPAGADTILRLRHSGLPVAAQGEHKEGWLHYLDRLVIAGAGADPGPDPWVAGDIGSPQT